MEKKLLPEKRTKLFNKCTVEGVLTNPFYGGRFQWKGEWFDGKHELIVPKEWVDIVDGKRGKAKTSGPVGAFSFLMTCAVPNCGCTVIYDPKTKTNKTNDRQRTYHYYHCSDGKRLHKTEKIKQVNVTEQRLWELFSEPIKSISIDEKLADFVMAEINQLNENSAQSKLELLKKTKERIEILNKREDELYEHWISGLLTKETGSTSITGAVRTFVILG